MTYSWVFGEVGTREPRMSGPRKSSAKNSELCKWRLRHPICQCMRNEWAFLGLYLFCSTEGY